VSLFELEFTDLVVETEFNFQGQDFLYFEDPVSFYSLKNLDFKITSFEQLHHYCEILFYLNPEIDLERLTGIFTYLGSRDSGKCIRTYGKARIKSMCEDVYKNKPVPYCRRMRRVIFNPDIVISTRDKMSITASLVSRSSKFTKMDIIKALSNLFYKRQIATKKDIANEIGCAEKTVQRLMEDETLKAVMKENNDELKKEKQIADVIECLDILSDEGNKVKIRALKQITNVRNYKLIKEAYDRYEKKI
jgi:hypothetical protein